METGDFCCGLMLEDWYAACDVASIAPEACQIFFQDYSRRFALMHSKYPALVETAAEPAGFLKPGRWQHHMMGDADAEQAQYPGQLLKSLPCKTVRVPPRIRKALTDMIEDDTSIGESDNEAVVDGEHASPFGKL